MKVRHSITCILFSAAVFSCGKPQTLPLIPSGGGEKPSPVPMTWEAVSANPASWDGEKRASVTYQLLVYSFADSNGDGWGDIKGITQHLDYLEGLGVSALWLSPIHPADSYHGYDVRDYYSVRKELGTEEDLKELITEARKRGMVIYLDYVLNHTGEGHPWFKSARASAGSEYRDYYVISSSPQADIQAGKIPSLSSYDSNKWHLTASGSKDYYYGAFGGWMPDLNYGPLASLQTNATFNDLAASAKKWIEMGVGGFRLDAVLYLYEKNAPSGNAQFLKAWYERCNEYYKAIGHADDIYMVGEAWTGTDVMAQYYKGLPALFDFEYWDRLSWALNSSIGRYFTKDVLNIRNICKGVRSDFVEATKLTNHDQTRAATTLGKSLNKEKLAACVLLTSPGSPYVYQGEELGYWGKVGDDGGKDEQVRTPVKWTRTGTVPSSWTNSSNIDKSMLSADISVEAQSEKEGSLLKVYQDFARLRNTYPALASGEMSAHGTYNDSNDKQQALAVWYMTSGSQKLLVVHNFSGSEITASFPSDKLTRAIGLNGSASIQGSSLKLGAYSSVIFEQ